MIFDRIHSVYLIGICGTAMASLAGLLKQRGYHVSGSDNNVYPPMSTQLEQLGIRLHSGYRADNLRSVKPDLVIPGNAIPRGNPELEEMLNLRLPYASMAEVVRDCFLRDKRAIVIAGTHGKTTTSCMAASVLKNAGLHPSFLVGGIPLNFGKSFHWQAAGAWFVIEGDEYDTGFMDRRPKFVQYLPQHVVLNAVEFDHADIYADLAAVENAFWQLIKVVPAQGSIIVNGDNETACSLAKRGYSNVLTFGFEAANDFRITGERWEQGTAFFSLNGEEYSLETFGRHNLANAAAVAVLGRQLDLKTEDIRRGLAAFRGVKRRMELRGEARGVAVYDDFAHHPTAIRTTLEGVRLAFPKSRIWAVFEPRSWSSRRNVFQQQFSTAFEPADVAIIAGVFEPEKVPPEIRLDPERLVADMNKNGTEARYMPDSEQLLKHVVRCVRAGDKLVLMSNGSFDGLHDKILQALKE